MSQTTRHTFVHTITLFNFAISLVEIVQGQMEHGGKVYWYIYFKKCMMVVFFFNFLINFTIQDIGYKAILI